MYICRIKITAFPNILFINNNTFIVIGRIFVGSRKWIAVSLTVHVLDQFENGAVRRYIIITYLWLVPEGDFSSLFSGNSFHTNTVWFSTEGLSVSCSIHGLSNEHVCTLVSSQLHGVLDKIRKHYIFIEERNGKKIFSMYKDIFFCVNISLKLNTKYFLSL